MEPEAAAAEMALAFAMAGFGVVGRVLRRGPPLRRCPGCRADGVRALEDEGIDAFHVMVCQECGQCGLWRRGVTSVWAAGRHERRLENDRGHIGRRAERLERGRVRVETRTFLGA